MSEDWVDGTYESGADQNDPIEPTDDEGTTEGDGVELGIGEGSTFEPEEDAAP
jgi:hypothetical protein